MIRPDLCIDVDLWRDFLLQRKALKKPLTRAGAKRFRIRLEAMLAEYDVNAAIANSIESGWCGVLQPHWNNQPWKLNAVADPGASRTRTSLAVLDEYRSGVKRIR